MCCGGNLNEKLVVNKTMAALLKEAGLWDDESFQVDLGITKNFFSGKVNRVRV